MSYSGIFLMFMVCFYHFLSHCCFFCNDSVIGSVTSFIKNTTSPNPSCRRGIRFLLQEGLGEVTSAAESNLSPLLQERQSRASGGHISDN